ncbi:uncharacterized protein LOC141902612 [Tubulanus polymorphus]|uniref:uncharacterized protein LOC141902612 n=1 Tax=Tubulanus polymorphus TaxID=672921 RepID=UPI003DA52C3A
MTTSKSATIVTRSNGSTVDSMEVSDAERLEDTLTTYHLQRIYRPRLKNTAFQFTRYPMQKCLLIDQEKRETFRRLTDTKIHGSFGRLIYTTALEQRQIHTPLPVTPISTKCVSPSAIIVRSRTGDILSTKHTSLCDWFESPPPDLDDVLRWRTTKRIEKQVKQDFSRNENNNYPLSTVLVRWHRTPGESGYSKQQLREIFNEFGPIRTIKYSSSCSAVVVFENLVDSCKLITAAAATSQWLGDKQNRLACKWYHSTMSTKKFYFRGQGMWVRYN